MRIACVYRAGADFGERDVRDLMVGIKGHLNEPQKTICLTDKGTAMVNNTVDKVIPLLHDWPSWWSKMELFQLPGPVLYFDLDTVILGDITPLIERVAALKANQFIMLRGFYQGDCTSGIMGWSGDMRWLYEDFLQTSRVASAKFVPVDNAVYFQCKLGHYRGDQDYIRERLQEKDMEIVLAQHIFPGIYSYKVDIMGRGVPTQAKIICFHGKPRPSEVSKW